MKAIIAIPIIAISIMAAVPAPTPVFGPNPVNNPPLIHPAGFGTNPVNNPPLTHPAG